MKNIKAKMLMLLGTMLMVAFSNFSVAQTDTSRTGTSTGTDRTPGMTTPSTPGMQGTTGTNKSNSYGSTRSDTSGRASMYYSQAQKAADDLKTRLNLTSEQTSQVRDILIDYQSDMAEQNMSGKTNRSSETGGTSKSDLHQTINERIDNVLNDNQKKEFSSMKSEWWSKMDNSFNSNSKSKRGSGTYKSGTGTDKTGTGTDKTGTGTDKTGTGTGTDKTGTGSGSNSGSGSGSGTDNH